MSSIPKNIGVLFCYIVEGMRQAVSASKRTKYKYICVYRKVCPLKLLGWEEIVIKTTALIMAGGRGERFWPKSRKRMPKQFLSLTNDNKTMIQHTVERILPIVDMEDIYIATNKDYREIVKEQLPGIPAENILCEPVG